MTQSNISTPTQSEYNRRAVLVAQNIGGNNALFLILGIYLTITTGTWQAIGVIFLALEAVIGGFVSASQIKQGRSTSGAWLLLITNCIAPASAAWIIANFSWVSVFYIAVSTYFIYTFAIPKEMRRSAIATVIIALIIPSVSWFVQGPWMLVSPAMVTIAPIFVTILSIALIAIIANELRKSVATSLRVQITVWTGVLLVIAAVITISYSIITSRQAAIRAAQNEAQSIVQGEAESIKIQIEPAVNIARTLAATLGTVKDPDHPISLTREQANGILRKVAEENPSFLGTWTIWEPNAFDGQDAQFANKPLHDATGRFLPYWVRVNDIVEGQAIVDYETPKPGVNDWYYIPSRTKQETLIPPYFYSIDGADTLLTTISVPIVENGRFYGLAGVDYRVDFVQGIVDGINLYGGTANAALFTTNGTLVAVRNQPDLALQSATTIFDDFAVLQPQLESGKTLVSISPDGKFLRVFAPVSVLSGAEWSFALIIPVSEITAPATSSSVREALINFGVIALAIFALWYLTGLLVRPITDLTSVANAVAAGDLKAVAKTTSENETGILATAFNFMTSQLRETLSSLEQRVADRTRNLELAAEVGRSVSQVRSLDVMLKDAAELIRSQFDLYYVQVYLTDANQANLLLLSGTGQVGEQLVGRGHRLLLNTGSINGRAAIEKKSVIIADTVESATFRPNPLLPNTRSEMAIPLIVGDKVVGVLDLQSEKANALSQELLPAFEALAGQLAIAIQNANLLAEAEQARAEVEAQARRLVRANWADYMDAIHKPEETGFVFEQNKIMPLAQAERTQGLENGDVLNAPIEVTGEALGNLVVEFDSQSAIARSDELVNAVAQQVAQHIEALRLLESAERYRSEAEQAARRLTREGWKSYTEKAGESLKYIYDLNEVRPLNGDNVDAAATVPLKVGDEVVGKFAIQGLDTNDAEAITLANAVAERLSAHIESLRQYDQTQSALAQSEKLFQASRRLTQSESLQDLVVSAVEALGISEIDRVVLGGLDYTSEGELASMTVMANWSKHADLQATPVGTHYPKEVLSSVSLFSSSEPLFFNDMLNDARVDETTQALAKRVNYRAVAALPLYVGARQDALLLFEGQQPHSFTSDEIRLFNSLAPQLATVLENRRQFERAQEQAKRESTLNVISQKIQSATSVEAVLQIAARELGHALGAPMTVAQLSMKDKS